MLRKLLLAAVLGLLCTATIGLAADEPKPDSTKPAKFDKAKLFEKLDANADGNLTKEEFKKFREGIADRVKEKVGDKAGALDQVFDKMFEKMDANGDGKVTKEEFEKFQPAGGLGGLGEKLNPEKLKELLKKRKGNGADPVQ